MFDQCLKILLIFGLLGAVARGEDEYTSTSTSTIASNYNECYTDDPNCDWENDPSANQTWNLIRRATVDGKQLSAYLSGSSPRGNSSVRMISPIFSRVDNYSCVSIYFQMYNTESKSGLVGLRVYQKPVHIALRDLITCSDEAKKDYIIFEVWGDQGSGWLTKEFPLKHFDSNFQIILEGIFGEDLMRIAILYITLKQRTECKGNTAYQIHRPTTSTTISTTTTMSTTTTERAMEENGDTITDKVTKSDTWVDSRPASPQSKLWPTTWPTTKQQTTAQRLQEGNGCDSINPPAILYLIAPGNSLIDFRVRPRCSAGAGTYRLNDLKANTVGTSSFIDHEKKPSDAIRLRMKMSS